jgi:hypothetical protein
MIQGSQEWLQARCGKVTASRVHDIVATTKSGGYTAGRKNYLAELVTERLTGVPAPSYQSPAMLWGIECEHKARFAYALDHGVEVEEVGFVPHPRITDAGCSPDGLLRTNGLLEIKCPNTATMIEVLLGAKTDPGYINQMQFQLACTGRQWCDLVTYDPRLPAPMQMHVTHFERDDKAIAELELEVQQFLIDLDATVDLLRKRYMQEAA